MSDNKIRVSIVEDVEEIREGLRLLINGSIGFECDFVYPDAEAALENLPSKEVDVILMDISLPRMSGIECMSRLKEKMPNAQFLMCTVNDDDDNIFNALQSGATGYILKRTAPAKILEAIRDLYDGGSPMSCEIARRVVSSMQKKRKTSNAIELLTVREKEVLEFLSKGFLYKEIAVELFISKATVKQHIHNIYEKLHVQTRTEALNKAYSR